MSFNRRLFLCSAGAAAFGALACSRQAEAQTVVSPERFGARGDGATDDTAALQRCFDAAPPGSVIRLRRGAVYLIDTNATPTYQQFGGVRIGPRQVLELNGAELRALPTQLGKGAVVQGYRADGWRIRGPGRIRGERSSHTASAGEWGMGVAVFSCSDWSIGAGVEVDNCWGDGIYVAAGRGGTYCDDFLIENVRVFDCRRNGITIVAGRNGVIRSAEIHDINGASPRGGIDLEPNSRTRPNRNIAIRDCRIYGTLHVGIYVTVANEAVEISRVDVNALNSGIIIGENVRDLSVTNSRLHSRRGGREGAAIRAVGDSAAMHNLQIRNNRLSGGGNFVVDFVGDEFPGGLLVTGNEIRASNPGVQGVARIISGTFTDNVGIIEATAGSQNATFLYLESTAYGGNSYRNLSNHSMRGVYRGCREVAPDRYLSASLTPVSAPLTEGARARRAARAQRMRDRRAARRERGRQRRLERARQKQQERERQQ